MTNNEIGNVEQKTSAQSTRFHLVNSYNKITNGYNKIANGFNKIWQMHTASFLRVVPSDDVLCRSQGSFVTSGTKIMAAQLSSPITVWINLCDREPAREEEVMALVREHVLQFFEVYAK